MDIDEFLSAVKSGGSRDKSERREARSSDSYGEVSRKRPKLSSEDQEVAVVRSGIMKRTSFSATPNPAMEVSSRGGGTSGEGLEISDEERMKILQLVQDEPEVRIKSLTMY